MQDRWMRNGASFLGGAMALEGLLLLLTGRRYVRLWRLGPRGNPVREGARWLAKQDRTLLRLLGVAELLTGVLLGTGLLFEHPSRPERLSERLRGLFD